MKSLRKIFASIIAWVVNLASVSLRTDSFQWVQDYFNGWFGSNITYIANAFEKSYFVWVFFSDRPLNYNKFNVQVVGSDTEAYITMNIDDTNVPQECRIAQLKHHKQVRNVETNITRL